MADGAASSELLSANSFQGVPLSESDVQLLANAKPVARSEAIIDEICDGLREGITLQQICRRKHMPHRTTVFLWRRADPELTQRLARARAEGCESLIEESLEIVDDGSNDYIDREVSAGRMQRVLDTEHVQRSRLRADHRLKIAAAWDPATYGAKTALNVSGTLTLEALVLASLPSAQPALLNVTPQPADDGSDLL